MKKNIELMMAMQFAELAVCNLDAVMKDGSITDKEFNAIREAHDSIASARHAINILERTLGKVSGYQTDDGILEHKCAISAVKKLYEHKPIEWKQENREELTEFENAMMHIGGSFFGENAGLDPNDTAVIKEQAELLLELAPKTEWSEEDISKVQRICKYLNEAKKYYADITEVRECVDWLKSLKQRYTWKPSDEQIRALHNMNLTGNISYTGQGQILIGLYNDLKKRVE